MDGTRTLPGLAEAFQEQFGSALPEASLSGFVERLETLGLLEGERSEKASSALASRQADDRGVGRLLFVKLKAIDPDVWLGRWARRLRLLFRPWFWPASLLVIAGALVIVAQSGDAFRFSLAGMLQGSSIPLLIVSIFLVISLHEIAHGLVCRHLGGHVNEMGFLLLYFQPCLYCDLSDAWLFREKWKKLLVTFSGAYFQVLLGAVGVLGWRVTTVDTLPNQLFWLVAVVSLFNVLFNFNPLIKLDGYYLLSDGLGIPNLRFRAFRWMGHRLFGRDWPYVEPPTRRERRIYWFYGMAAVVYSVFLIGYLAVVSLTFVVDRWRGPGLLLYLFLAAVMFRRPIGRATRAAVPRTLHKVRKPILWGLAGLAAVIALLVPLEYRVGSPARIEPWAQMTVSVLVDGYVRTEWYENGQAELTHTRISKLVASGFTTLHILPSVEVGDRVLPGDTVLHIATDEFTSVHTEAQAGLRAKQAELDLLKSGPKPEAIAEAQARIREEESLLNQSRQTLTRTQSLFDRNLAPQSSLEFAQTAVAAQEARLESARQALALLAAPPKQEEVAKVTAEISKLQTQVTFYGDQLESTVYTSPVAGTVLRLASQNEVVCRIARTDSVRCVMNVAEADVPLLQPGQKVTLKTHSEPFRSFEGTLIWIAPVGDWAGESSTFMAVAALPNSGELSVGTSGYAKVSTGRRTGAWRLIRGVARFIRIEFWSWW